MLMSTTKAPTLNFSYVTLGSKLQPLCYDLATESMVPVEMFTPIGAYSANWIRYANNNPPNCAAGSSHCLGGPHPINANSAECAGHQVQTFSRRRVPG